MHTLSVKELRLNLPKVIKKIQQGKEFVLIYRSKPVGELIPIRSQRLKSKKKDFYSLLENPFGEISLSEGETSVSLIRKERS